MIVSFIAAQGHNRVIGKANRLPWDMPADLAYFREKTRGHTVIMGRKTYESVLHYVGGPMPKRVNIVVTQSGITLPGVEVAQTAKQALEIAKKIGDEEVFVLGGGVIFELFMPFANRIYLTLIDVEVDGGDAFFPALEPNEWRETWREPHKKDAKNPYDYTFVIMERVKK